MIPPERASVADFILTPEQLEHELLVMTDRFTDELFAFPTNVATTVAFPVSRLVVDPERFTKDSQEPMARKGGSGGEKLPAGGPPCMTVWLWPAYRPRPSKSSLGISPWR
jgi:N-formylglutamate amidohydrolase